MVRTSLELCLQEITRKEILKTDIETLFSESLKTVSKEKYNKLKNKIDEYERSKDSLEDSEDNLSIYKIKLCALECNLHLPPTTSIKKNSL